MRIAFALLFLPAAYCQDVERVFRLTGTPGLHGQQEIATTLRSVGNFNKLTVDQETATVTIHAPASQVTFSEWLVPRLDHPPASPQQYNVTGNPNDIVVTYPTTNVKDVIGRQEIITTLRTVIDLNLIYNISSASMLVFRGNPSNIEQANFLLSELDRLRKPSRAAVIDHFTIANPFRNFDTLTAYHLVHASNNVAIQKIIAILRTIADIQKIYSVTANATLAICASQSDTRVAEWLIDRLDRESPDQNISQIQLPGGKDDVIRVFYLSHLSNPNQLESLNKAVRGATETKKSYWTQSPATLVVRGTADGVESAALVVKKTDSGE